MRVRSGGRPWVTGIALCILSSVIAVVTEAAEPEAVSPGDIDRVSVTESRCPTFSWSADAGAGGYEVVVYRLGASRGATETVLQQTFVGAVTSWTPSLEACLDRGAEYAWSVRSLTDDPSPWSTPSLFAITPLPTEAELSQALEVVTRYLQVAPEDGNDDSARHPTGIDRSRQGAVPGSADAIGNMGEAELVVVGEIRTLDANGEPRLWGRGRPGTRVFGSPVLFGVCVNGAIKYGLSEIGVTWGAAADACPAGTWVCHDEEIVACNTERPDGTVDRITCDGTELDLPENGHVGWTAGHNTVGDLRAINMNETGVTNSSRSCITNPVWCCWQ